MTQASYDEIADWYNESIQTNTLMHDLVLPPIFDLLGDVRGQRICDLACGQGVLSRALAERGAGVVGVDLSAKMLEIARQYEDAEPLGIVYLQDNAHTLTTLEDAAFDGVLCNVALMDIPDLKATFHSVKRILRPGGWFVFSLTHPCFHTPLSGWLTEAGGTIHRTVRGYFDEKFWFSDNPHGVRGKVGAYHRTLSSYINTLAEAGLLLERLIEPQTTRDRDVRKGYNEVPALFVARCRKIYLR
jgi:2-polyprenyl-3-methyl-5-hydroxy-6-metoxy-1,4-benzoquinol methylase